MILSFTLQAEWLKLRRTIALKMVVIAPAAVVLLTLFMASQSPYSTLRRSSVPVSEWAALTRVNLQFWGMLMLPLYLTLQTALLAGLEHSDNQWKALFARPVPRWTIYVSKLLVVVAMSAISALVLVACMLGEGAILHALDHELRFALATAPVGQMLKQTAQVTALAFLALTISHWVSLRWRSFAVAIGFGVVAMVTGFAMLLTAGREGSWPQFFPWSLPALVLARTPQNIELALQVGGGLGIAAAALGCADFCRREVS